MFLKNFSLNNKWVGNSFRTFHLLRNSCICQTAFVLSKLSKLSSEVDHISSFIPISQTAANKCIVSKFYLSQLKLTTHGLIFEITVAMRFVKKLIIVVVVVILTWMLYKALFFDNFDPDSRRQAMRESRIQNKKIKVQTTTEKDSDPEPTPDSFFFPPAPSAPD